MDSGLGSDDEKRNRTKAQKQLQNVQKQLFSGCFIDATSLGDEGEFDQRRHDERRQGALVFRSSIPQYSMLQMPHADDDLASISHIQEDNAGVQPLETSTPHNSIVQLETELERKTPIGFFVDLGNVEVPESPAPAVVEKKNIFSMVIDFNVPKRDMPSRLSSSLYGRRKQNGNNSTSSLTSSCSSLREKVNGDCQNDLVVENGIDNVIVEFKVAKTVESTNLDENGDAQSLVKDEGIKSVDIKCHATTVSNIPRPTKQYVKLSDLEAQSPRLDLFIAPRMSRSIPEKSWVESPLATFHSASYRSSPQPFQSNLHEPSETSNSLTESTNAPPPKRSAQRLGTDLLRMFLEEIGPDVTLDINGRKIRAHKCILSSRCQYFAAVFGGKPSSENIVSIQGYSYAAVHFALCHIYSGAAHVPHSISLVELGALADMLGLEGLKEVVAHALKVRYCHSFHKPCTGCITGVVEVLPLAAAYGLDELYQDCLHWITKHFDEVWPTRMFASLSKELRNKCYQQHVVHMIPDTFLATTLKCDRLLATMPTAKWAEPIAQLTLQLADHCQGYLRQNYSSILNTPHFLALDKQHENISQLEESLVSAAGALKLEQTYRSYMVCHKMVQNNNWSARFAELLHKIYKQIENCVVRQSGQPSRNNLLMQLEPALRKRIRDLSASCSRLIKPKVEPLTSSSDSSRNSSPAIKNTQRNPLHSPSLRRSLLLAARANTKSPTSPSTCRRTSTLTNPTQSSAAKSNIKTTVSSQKKTPTKTTANSKIILPQKIPIKRETTPSKPNPNPNRKKVMVSSNIVVSKTASNNNTNTKSTIVTSTRAAKKPNVGTTKQRAETGTSTANAENAQQSPGVRRSDTFLKDEPTVLGKM